MLESVNLPERMTNDDPNELILFAPPYLLCQLAFLDWEIRSIYV
ncbi:hypothetical protein Cal7507_2452 [Calothrix sp. PCC 7507]|nr:hypothetical protein Cal7507_2452 [Calothrix sp. PCC 7507]